MCFAMDSRDDIFRLEERQEKIDIFITIKHLSRLLGIIQKIIAKNKRLEHFEQKKKNLFSFCYTKK